MLELFTWNTPNGQKPAILLEELGLEYTLRLINLGAGEQHQADYLAVNPNAKIPALLDRREGETRVFESGAVLQYLAEGTPLLAAKGAARAEVLSWTYWQVGGIGPMLGQWGHFSGREPAEPYAAERFLKEVLRLYRVLEGALVGREHVAGAYSIADIMLLPWVQGGLGYLTKAGVAPSLPAVEAWVARVERREAVVTAREKLAAAVAVETS